MRRILSAPAGKIDYTLKRSKRARRLRLCVNCEAAVVAVAPWSFPLVEVENFIVRHADWIARKVGFFKSRPRRILPGGSRADFLRCRRDAYLFVKERIAHFNRFYGLAYRRISIKAPKTRWGSCSRKGNLNFNYKIIKLPERLADYIIVHELCHLKEMNHSRYFWNLVERAVPDYKACRRELRNIF